MEKNKVRKVFDIIEIETYNKCNNICEFCPVNIFSDIRETSKMKSELIEKIANELKEINYGGRVHLFSNNEPLLDERIIEIAEYFYGKLERAKKILYTNGILLNSDNISKLIKYVDILVINSYSNINVINPEIKNSIKVLNYEECKKVKIRIRKLNEVLTTRGGSSPNKKISIPIDEPCEMPFIQMVIRPTGHCSLCCQDAYGQYTLGNANNTSLLDIWNGENYRNIRNEISKGRKNVLMCSECDFIWKKQYGFTL